MFEEIQGYDLKNAQPWVLKMLAKRIKKSDKYGLKHSQILDKLCKLAGFNCWNTYSAYWKDRKYETSVHVSREIPQEFQEKYWRSYP